jgi:hypothetical protein
MSTAQHRCDSRYLARHAYVPPRRNELAALCDRCLRDIGVTRYDAYREISKPFWRA